MSGDWHNLLPDKCDWCPLMCGANRAAGASGLCGADDKLLIARCNLHFWEEPPISGTFGGPKRGQGPGSGTVFFSNCNMKCVYCQNYEISGISKNIKGKAVNLNELVNIFLDLQKKGAMNINIVTGTHYRSHIITALRIAKQQGLNIPIVWNTSGYETLASIYALSDVVDVWLPDFKYGDNNLCAQLSQNKISNYTDIALEAIDAMLSFIDKPQFDNFNENLRMTKGIIVRHMLLPGQLENSKKALNLLFTEFGNSIKYSIMNQYTPVLSKDSQYAKQFPELLETVSNNIYEELLDYADKLGIEDYYWQEGGTCSESFIPNWDF